MKYVPKNPLPLERFIRRLANGMETIAPIKEGVYEMPTKVIFGRMALEKISSLPYFRKEKKIVLVTGKHFMDSDNFAHLKSALKSIGNKVTVYNERIFKSDFISINKLTDFCKKETPDTLMAIGGGTILDTAKCAAILSKNKGVIEDYIKRGEKLENKGVKFIAVPTTAGTGSEVTPWATVWDTKAKKKYSLNSLMMFPALAIVDPQLTDSLPPRISAETGIDALAQAIEAYWSKQHNPISDIFAIRAIKLIMNNLEKATNGPDEKSREAMSEGSLLAGLAFSNTTTTICHAVSYPMTAHFNIPHGQAVALTLASFLGYSYEAIDRERRKLLLEAIGNLNVTKAIETIRSLMGKIGLETKLSQLGIEKDDIQLIVDESFYPERVDKAPKIPTKEELKNILAKIF